MICLVLLTLLSNVLAKPYQQVETNFCTDKQPGLFSQGCSPNVTICNSHGKEMWLLCPFELVFDGSIEECKDRRSVTECGAMSQGYRGPERSAQGLPDRLCEGSADGYHSATDCSNSVVQCVKGVSRLLECSKGQVFDNNKQSCESPNEVPACRAADESSPTSTSSGPGAKNGCEGQADGFFEKEPCSSFFLTCSGGVSRILTCPSNLVFDKRLGICEYPENVEGCNSQSGEGSHADCSEDGYFSYGNCSDLFYACSNGRQISMYCPANLAFDEATQRCDYPGAVAVCNQQGSGENSGEWPGESSGECSGEGSGEASGESSGECSGEGSGEASGESSGECSGEGSGEASGESLGECSGESSGKASGENTGEDFETSSRESTEMIWGEQTELLSWAIVDYGNRPLSEQFSGGTSEESAETLGESSRTPEGHSSKGKHFTGGHSYSASGTDRASGESSGDQSQDDTVSTAASPTQQITSSEQLNESTSGVSSFCKGKKDGFYAFGCSSEMIACKGSRARSMLCPAHMLYDEKKRVCDYPENVACYAANKEIRKEECTTDGSSALGRCSSAFTSCVQGKSYQLECEEGYVFSEEHKSCTEPSKLKECSSVQSQFHRMAQQQQQPDAGNGYAAPKTEEVASQQQQQQQEQPAADNEYVAPKTEQAAPQQQQQQQQQQPAADNGYAAPKTEQAAPQQQQQQQQQQPAADNEYVAPKTEQAAPQQQQQQQQQQPAADNGYAAPKTEQAAPQQQQQQQQQQPAADNGYAAPKTEQAAPQQQQQQQQQQPAADNEYVAPKTEQAAPQQQQQQQQQQPAADNGYAAPKTEQAAPQQQQQQQQQQPAADNGYAAPKTEQAAPQQQQQQQQQQPAADNGYAAPKTEQAAPQQQQQQQQQQPAADNEYVAPKTEQAAPPQQQQQQQQQPAADNGYVTPKTEQAAPQQQQQHQQQPATDNGYVAPKTEQAAPPQQQQQQQQQPAADNGYVTPKTEQAAPPQQQQQQQQQPAADNGYVTPKTEQAAPQQQQQHQQQPATDNGYVAPKPQESAAQQQQVQQPGGNVGHSAPQSQRPTPRIRPVGNVAHAAPQQQRSNQQLQQPSANVGPKTVKPMWPVPEMQQRDSNVGRAA